MNDLNENDDKLAVGYLLIIVCKINFLVLEYNAPEYIGVVYSIIH